MEKLDCFSISNKLGTLFKNEVTELKESVPSFRTFSDEALMSAIFRYGRFPRDGELATNVGRLKYLYEKAFLFDYGKECRCDYFINNDEIVITPVQDPPDLRPENIPF